MNSADIGTTAGDVYRFLASNGSATVADLKRATGHGQATVHQAIGWLAREDKIISTRSGRTTRWTIAQC